MKKNLACWFAFLIGNLLVFSSTAQITQANYFLPTFYPRSPNTSAIEKFGSYNVNLFTGLPDISIPLYSINVGGVQYPISLSYHASGIRVPEIASWVGLGWSLSAGGVISRNIVGKADDGIQGYLQGYLKSVAALGGHTDASIDSINNYNLGTYDARPDIFSYSFPSHGGKFFLDGTSNFVPRLIPYAPIGVTYNYVNSGNPAMTTFNVVDEHGNKYTFGDQYQERTYTSTQSTPAIASTTGWPLEYMVTQNKRDTIRFTYSEQYVYLPDVVSNTDVVDDQIQSPQNFYTYGYKQGNQNISSSYTSEKLLQHIYFKNGRVDFELETTTRADLATSNAYALKFILVYGYNYGSKVMELQKKIRFYTSYFNSLTSNAKRLKLDSIQVIDKAGSVAQSYSFDYNTSIPLPFYGSMARDYWGFYNGKANTTLTPNMTVPVSQYPYTMTIGSSIPNSRYSDSTYMQAGVLTSIHYPTGGNTQFTYQTNQYWDAGVGSLMQAGGLRIKSIASYDGVNPTPMVKTYVYNNNTARKNFILDNVFFSTQIARRRWNYAKNHGDPPTISDTEIERTFVSNPRIDIEAWDAATVVYPQVTEYSGTPAANVGRTDYLFRDLSDTQAIGSMTGTPIINSYFYARGQLIRKSDFLRKNDGSYQVAKVDSSSYTAFNPTTYMKVGLTVGKTLANEGIFALVYPGGVAGGDAISANGYVLANYDITSDDNYLTGTLTRLYDITDPSKYTTSVTEYKYDNIKHQQVSRTRHVDSKGNTNINISKYPADYLTGTTTNNAVLDSMLSRNMQAEVIEKWDSVKNVTSGINGVTSGQLNLYSLVKGNLGAIVADKISRLQVAAPLINFTPYSSGNNYTADSRYKQMISFDSYDLKNNIARYTPRNATQTAIIWDYNSAMPVAQIKNASPASSTNSAYTSFEADGVGNWYFNGKSVYDVTAPTGKRSYNLSSGNVTSPYFDNTKNYILSLWAKGSAPSVYYASSYQTAVPLRIVNGWTYYEYKLAAGSTQAVISGTATVDELRLYPADAQMTTYTYDPNGLIQTTDTKSQTSNFEYDFASRLKNIKDWNGNIVKNFGYHTYDMTYGNTATSGTFTRDNCPPNTTGQSTTYSVAANTYYSSSIASANAMAAYDLQTNGQLKADNPAYCGCPSQMVNFTLTNTTGISTFQVSFSGPASYSFTFPANGSTAVSVAAGVYTVTISPTGTYANHTFGLGSRAPVTAPGTTFNNVNITAGSNESPLKIQ